VIFVKISDIRKLVETASKSNININEYQLHNIQDFGLQFHNFYQELEMESPYVDTHIDISYSNATFQFHSHAFYELICCHNSCGAEYMVGAERYKLQKGDIILVPPDTSHRPLLPDPISEPYSRDVLWLSVDFMNFLRNSHYMEPEDFTTPILYRTNNTRWEYICNLFRSGVKEAQNQDLGWETIIISNTMTILTHLRRAGKDMSAKPLKAEKPELLDQVMAYVEQHLSEKITLSDIAHHFFVSESTITQTFRRKIGVSFYRCVTQRRLIAAKTLIERGILMDSVAEQVGFTDYSSFFRAFKQEFGISPRQYRKMQGNL
jgi:AraC-like DNA-binding protein